MNFLITDSVDKIHGLDYIARTTEETFCAFGGCCDVTCADGRATYFAEAEDISKRLLFTVVCDKIADVIAISYKYRYFKERVRTAGLDKVEYEYLLTALISADLDEDKRYVTSMTDDISNFPIDGFFNFRLKKLREKWNEVVGFIPTYFSAEKLEEFISFIVGEKRGRRCYVGDGKVFDGRFNRLRRGMLTDKVDGGELVKEVILSGAGEVELSSEIPCDDKAYLKRFFGDKVYFSSR